MCEKVEILKVRLENLYKMLSKQEEELSKMRDDADDVAEKIYQLGLE